VTHPGLRHAIAGAWLLMTADAYAQEKLCAGTYSHQEWLGAMDQADGFLASFKLKEARVTIYAARELVPCLDAIAKPSHLGRYARQLALLEFLAQDEETSARWALLSRTAAPALPWPADIPDDHPFREAVSALETPSVTGPADKGLLIPKGGAAFLDGTPLNSPQALADVPHLYQVTDAAGVLVSAYWIDGGGFHEEALTVPGKPPRIPKWWTPEPEADILAMKLPLVFGLPDSEQEAEDAVADVASPPPAPPKPPATTPQAASGWTEATPAVVEKPPATPAVVEKPPATPAVVEKPPAAPAVVEKPPAAPAVVEKPPAPPAVVEKPPAAPAVVEKPPAAPAVVEKPPAAPTDPAANIPRPPPVVAEIRTHKGPSLALLGAGGGAALVAGGLYTVAFLSGDGLAGATTESELISARTTANALTLGAGTAGLLAVGLTGGAFLSADLPWGVHLHRRF
jgi:hypothetical protein